MNNLLRRSDLAGKVNRREILTASQGMSTSDMSKNKVETGRPVSGNPTMMDKLSNYIIVDIGANLTNKKFSRDLDQVIQRATDAGVSKIMVTGTSLHSTKEALRLTRLYPGTLYSTAGIHPHDAKSWDDDTYNELKDAARCAECVAIGECGLDFNRNFSPPDVQIECLKNRWRWHVNLENPCFFMNETHIRKWCQSLRDSLINYRLVLSIASLEIANKLSSTFSWGVILV